MAEHHDGSSAVWKASRVWNGCRDVLTSADEPLRLNLGQLIVQRFQGDPQLFGCLRLVALMLVEDAEDHLFFHLPERSG